jgi:hypothetical protein
VANRLLRQQLERRAMLLPVYDTDLLLPQG